METNEEIKDFYFELRSKQEWKKEYKKDGSGELIEIVQLIMTVNDKTYNIGFDVDMVKNAEKAKATLIPMVSILINKCYGITNGNK